jgi:hypothetical protein
MKTSFVVEAEKRPQSLHTYLPRTGCRFTTAIITSRCCKQTELKMLLPPMFNKKIYLARNNSAFIVKSKQVTDEKQPVSVQ